MGPKGFKGKLAAVAALLALIGSAGAAAHEAHSKPAAKPAAEAPAGEPAALPLDLGGPFALTDHTGRAVSDADFRGSFMLVFFGYANCPGICPTGLRAMTEALDLLGEKGARVVPLLITVDPRHDTPGNLAPAVAKIHPRLIGLTGRLEALSAAAKAYKVSAKPAGRSWQGTQIIDHGSFVYLMGPDGKFLTLFPPVMTPEAMAKAIGGYLG
jgi:protein SCO1/2